MKLLILVLVLSSFSAFAEEDDSLNSSSQEKRVAECRQILHTKRNVYIEEMERCQGLLLRHSIEQFNRFADRREPVVDCQEAQDNRSLVRACRSHGVEKVKRQGSSWGFNIRDQDVYACDVDSGIFTSYVWFCANTPRGEIRTLTQKPLWQDCF